MKNKMNVIIQDEISECGLACIAMISSYYNSALSLPSLRSKFPVGLEGLSFFDLESVLLSYGFPSSSYNLDVNDVDKLQLPAILQWRNNHFVVLSKVTDKYMEIYDPAVGKKIYKKDVFSYLFSGFAMEVYPSPCCNKNTNKDVKQIRLIDIVKSIPKIKFLTISLFLALSISQFLLLLTPKLLSLVTDDVIEKRDIDMFYIIALIFMILFLFDFLNKTLLNEFKESVSVKINKHLSSVAANVLVSQNISYFEKRDTQDLIKRLAISLTYGQNYVQNHIYLINNFLFSFIFAALLWYMDSTIAIVVSISGLIFVAIRLAFLNRVQAIRSDIIEQEVNRNKIASEFINNVKGHKLAQSESKYQSSLIKTNNNQIKNNSYLSRFFNTGESVFFLLKNTTNILLCYFFVTKVFQGQLSVGSIFVIYFYKDFMLDNLSGAVEKALEIQKLKPDWIMLENLINAPMENPQSSNLALRDKGIIESVTLNNVDFRYSSFEKNTLCDVNISLSSNDYVGIIGRSGSGKSSLMKILSSLTEPSKGQFLVNGYDINKYGVNKYRKVVSMYHPDDGIYSTTVFNNIINNNAVVSFDLVVDVLEKVGLVDEINDLPNGLDTLLGEGGILLSSGQKQRLCIARALYSQPQILILDEPTANLDLVLKEKISDLINSYKGIKVVVTHDKALLANCNKVYKISGGVVEKIN